MRTLARHPNLGAHYFFDEFMETLVADAKFTGLTVDVHDPVDDLTAMCFNYEGESAGVASVKNVDGYVDFFTFHFENKESELRFLQKFGSSILSIGSSEQFIEEFDKLFIAAKSIHLDNNYRADSITEIIKSVADEYGLVTDADHFYGSRILKFITKGGDLVGSATIPNYSSNDISSYSLAFIVLGYEYFGDQVNAGLSQTLSLEDSLGKQEERVLAPAGK